MNSSNISNVNQSSELTEITSTLGFYLSDAETACVVGVFVLFGLIGFLENLVLILSTLLTDQFADTPANFFVISLAFADLLVCGVSAPLFIYNCYHPIFTIFINVSKFNAVASTGSIFTLTFDRYISLVKGLKYPKIMTLKRTVSLVAGTWISASFVVISAAFGLVWEIKPLVRMTRFFLGFHISSTILMYMYMYNLGRKHRRQLARQAYAVTGQIQAKFDEFIALRSLFMIAGSFALFWLPVTIAGFMTDVRKDPVQFYRAYIFTTPLCVVNSVVDPVVYYYRSKGFRKSMKMLVRRLKNSRCGECY